MVRELADGVWLLELGLVPPLASNAYLVEYRDALTLVDAGLFVNHPSIGSELAAAGYDASDIDRVLVTHYDIDHVGGLRSLTGFDGPVHVGAADLALADGSATPPLTHKGLFHRAVRPVWDLDGFDVVPVADGDRIGGFTAHHTPGHNPGHTVYVHDDLGLALLGDLVWEDGGTLTTPEWYDSYDMAQLRASVRALVDRLPAFEVAAMGHGDPILTGGHAALADLATRC
ncbi:MULTISPECIES: MBL fold metallo-hydrolase [Salinibaculum]|uniref:MBL fold metallo-hydrolase n=1 Tax=Salinibaculum TaxID=2732368 RepID=UPI0030CF25D6